MVAVEADVDLKKKKGKSIQKFKPDMIRRIDEPPKRINPSGWVSEHRPPSIHRPRTTPPDFERPFTTTPESFEEFQFDPQARRRSDSLDIKSI